MRNTILSVSYKFLTALAVTAMVLAALPAKPAFAASITVNITTDENTADGTNCSLREAIILANSNELSHFDCVRSGVGNDDIITLESGFTYTLTIPGTGGTTQGDLDIGDVSGTSGNLTIQSNGSTPAIIDASGLATPDRVFDVDAMGDPGLTLIGITVTGGNTTGVTNSNGGGIAFSGAGTLTLTNSTILNNISVGTGCGGGIYNNSAATVNITDSTIQGNSCTTAGGDGGGLVKGTGGTLTITNSTFYNNTAADNGGGAILNGGTATITNSTFAGNTAGNRGGGIQVGGATVAIDFSTLSGNISNAAASSNGSGAFQISSGSATISRSILANSTAAESKDCDKSSTGSAVLSNSLVENNSDCTGSFTAGDPGPLTLADNGGPTQTMAITGSSLAFNAAASCGSITTDQRGIARPEGASCDLGSYELQDLPTVVSVLRADANPTGASSVNYTVSFSEAVTGVNASDFSLTTTGGVSGHSVGTVTGSGALYNVVVNTGTSNGTIRLNVLDDNSIIDANSNPLNGGFTGGEVYTIDKTAPSVTSVTRVNPSPTNEDLLDFTVTFSEVVTGVDLTDFVVTATGAVSGATVDVVTGSGTTYTVTVGTGSGDGTIRLDVLDDNTILDLAGNALASVFTGGQFYTIDKSAEVEVTIGVNNVGNYVVGPEESVSDNYGINGGPVLVSSTDGMEIFTSQRAIFGSSFNSIVGYPANQLTTDYWFTSYDDLGMITYLVIGNPHPTLNAVVDVYIGGIKRNAAPYSIAPGQRIFPRYGINGGPVHVVSTNGVDIFTSERTKFGDSFNEVMGYPGNQVTTDYWFTSYDDVGMITYLVIGNPHPSNTALVDVYIAGVKKNTVPYAIAPGQRVFPRYAINGGPVRVVSTNGVDVFTSERSKFGQSFNEVLGYPADQLTTDYWFTSYDDASMITYLVIGNPHPTLIAEVEVYIAGALANTYSIAPGQRVFPRYGIDEGPVNVISTNGVDIFTSERSKYLSSFNEILGLSNDQLTTDYWFTSYDDLGMDTELVISAP